MRHARTELLRGALFLLTGELLFATMGAMVKTVTQALPMEMAVFFRNAFGLLVLLPLIHRHGGLALYRTGHFPLHALRAVVGLSAMYCFFYTLGRLPLADGVLLKMTAPLFIPLIAWAWLGEGATRLALLAVPVGFVGVILVLQPHGELQAAALVGLLGGALVALAKVSVRRLTGREPVLRIVVWFTTLSTALSALPLLWHWRTPDAAQWALLLGLGAVGSAAQLVMTRGYACAPAGQLSPLTYSSVLFGAGYGYLLWGEVPHGRFVLGALLIALAGMLAVYRPRGAPLPLAVQGTTRGP